MCPQLPLSPGHLGKPFLGSNFSILPPIAVAEGELVKTCVQKCLQLKDTWRREKFGI